MTKVVGDVTGKFCLYQILLYRSQACGNTP